MKKGKLTLGEFVENFGEGKTFGTITMRDATLRFAA